MLYDGNYPPKPAMTIIEYRHSRFDVYQLTSPSQ